jgi:PPOX class probable F420-dependent enzyme
MSTEQIPSKPVPETHRDLIERPIVAALATTLPDGTPQVTPIWFDSDEEGYIYFNTAEGRLKDRAIRKTPYVAFTIIDPDNPYRYIAARGPVVETSYEHGREHINQLSARYTGDPVYPVPEGQVRVRYKVAIEHVFVSG